MTTTDTRDISKVCRVAWPSCGPVAPPRDDRVLRLRKAVIQTLVAWAVAALLFFVMHREIFATVVASIGAVTLLSGLFVPPVFRAIEHAGLKLASWVTTGLTWGLMVPFFYLFFVPSRFVLKLRGKDPMHRVWDQDLSTYWVDRPAIDEQRHFTRQF